MLAETHQSQETMSCRYPPPSNRKRCAGGCDLGSDSLSDAEPRPTSPTVPTVHSACPWPPSPGPRHRPSIDSLNPTRQSGTLRDRTLRPGSTLGMEERTWISAQAMAQLATQPDKRRLGVPRPITIKTCRAVQGHGSVGCAAQRSRMGTPESQIADAVGDRRSAQGKLTVSVRFGRPQAYWVP